MKTKQKKNGQFSNQLDLYGFVVPESRIGLRKGLYDFETACTCRKLMFRVQYLHCTSRTMLPVHHAHMQ